MNRISKKKQTINEQYIFYFSFLSLINIFFQQNTDVFERQKDKNPKKQLIIREVLRSIILFVSPLNRIYHIVIGQYLMLHFECKEENVGEVYGYSIQIEVQLLKGLSGRRSGNLSDSKIIRIIAKTLRLSLLEAYTLSWLLQSSQSPSDFSPIEPACWHQNREYSSFFIQLLLNGYYVKSFLASPVLRQIEANIEILLPNFSAFYQVWRPSVSLSQLKIEDLNKPFNDLNQRAVSAVKDYNAAVNKILQLSKSYNIGGKAKAYPQKSCQQEMVEIYSEQPRISFDVQSHISLRQPNPLDVGERESMQQGDMEAVFRPFGASSGRGQLKDVNLESIFESKNMHDSLRDEPNQPFELPLKKQKNKKWKSIRHTFSFLEEQQQV